MITKIKQMIIDNICQLNNLCSEEKEEIEYGFNLLFDNLIKFLILLFIMSLLNWTYYFFIASLIVWFLKSCIGGIHLPTFWSCFVFSLAYYLLIVFLALYLPISLFVWIIVFTFILYITWKYAPADNEEKPLVNKELRKELKKRGIIRLILTFVLSLIIYFTFPRMFGVICYSIIFTVITIHPWIYKLFQRGYANYEKYL